MSDPVPADVVLKALRKMTAALQGLHREPVVIGALAQRCWGAKAEPARVELLIPGGEAHREPIFSAARGEGLQQAPEAPIQTQGDRTVLRLRYTDAKLGATAEIELLEASTMLLKKTAGRAKTGNVLGMPLLLATCDDVILLLAGSTRPGDRETVVELLRMNAGRIDPGYLKKEAEEAKVFDALKGAWQEAKRQG
jgi:hypothetical protein